MFPNLKTSNIQEIGGSKVGPLYLRTPPELTPNPVKAMPKRRLRSSRLPVELYRPIVQNILDQGDLCALCATSPILRYEAELVLYGHVQLSGDYSRLLPWALMITRTPRVAGLVHALTLPTLSTFRYPLRDVIAKALKALINLTELHIFQPSPPAVHPYLVTDMLDGCTFRLTKFCTELEDTDLSEYSNFFGRQQDIRYLMIQGEAAVMEPHLLPHLTQVRLQSCDVLKSFASRPLRCIRLDSVQMTDVTIARVVSSLVLFKASLNRLSIEMIEPSAMAYNDYLLSMPAMICLIAKKVHKLKFLCVSREVAPVSLFGVVTTEYIR